MRDATGILADLEYCITLGVSCFKSTLVKMLQMYAIQFSERKSNLVKAKARYLLFENKEAMLKIHSLNKFLPACQHAGFWTNSKGHCLCQSDLPETLVARRRLRPMS